MTASEFSFRSIQNFSYPISFTTSFFEDVMQWAYLKYLDLCLPEAKA